MPGYAVYAGERCPASQERYIMPHARMREQRCTREEKMYSVARAVGVCVGGKSIAAHHARREKEPLPP